MVSSSPSTVGSRHMNGAWPVERIGRMLALIVRLPSGRAYASDVGDGRLQFWRRRSGESGGQRRVMMR